MKNRPIHSWLPAYQWLAGLCDAATGVSLLLAPRWTLTLMGVRVVPEPLDFASFVGVFVLGVGSIYLWAARLPLDRAHAGHWQTAWRITALVRTLVAGFLTWKLCAARLEMAWLTVALTDGSLAAFQWTGLNRGWLEFGD